MITIFLIVGLGNPGSAYASTNHNVGFISVDFLAKTLGFPPFKENFNGLYSEKTFDETTNDGKHDFYKVIILKPQTFMNSSGISVQKFVKFYKITSSNVIVIHDDLDLKPGDIKIKFSGSSGGHNGIKSIDNTIGTEYWRVRIGIGRPGNKEYPIKDYVLAKIPDELKEKLPSVLKNISNNIKDFLLEAGSKSKTISKIRIESKTN